MDQNQRLERLKSEARRLSGGDENSFGIDNFPPDIAEQFLQRVIAFDTVLMFTDFAQLTAAGVELPDPGTVPEPEIAAVLWRVIVALSKRRVFLDRTNHLSDRELYSVLWRDVLREEHAALPEERPASGMSTFLVTTNTPRVTSPTMRANKNASYGYRTFRMWVRRVELLRTIAMPRYLRRPS